MFSPIPFDEDDRHGVPYARCADVIRAWHARVAGETPWRHMPLDDRVGELRPIVDELLVGDPLIDVVRPQRLAHAARAHGLYRRRQACSPTVLSGEIGALHTVLVAAIARSGLPYDQEEKLTTAVRRDLRTVHRAAAAGYLNWPAPESTD